MSDHAERVLRHLTTLGERPLSEQPLPFDSWVRCSGTYGLAPDGKCEVPRLGDSELARAREELGDRYALAQREVDHLFSIVRASGYSVTLANAECMIVTGQNDWLPTNSACDERPGTVWNERFGGTNAVGTSIHDMKATSVRRGEHFFIHHIHETCLNIPLIASDGRVWASLGLSNRSPDLDGATHALALSVLSASAERLAQEVFRTEFADCWVLKLHASDGRSRLLAVNDDMGVAGADAGARAMLSLAPRGVMPFSLRERFSGCEPLSASTPFDPARAVELKRRADGAAIRGIALPPLHRKPRGRRVEAGAATTARRQVTMDRWAGSDPLMLRDVDALRRLSGKRLPIILLGETGVGKDTLARAVHAESPRTGKPFVAVNCGAIPETLIESELFGYGSGAFTGARKAGAAGRFKQADGGTLFLDEIGEMPLLLQTRLLRVLDSGEVQPLGADKGQMIDVQVIAATNRDLADQVAAGAFRADLYHRLAGIVIRIPALRERSDKAAVIERLSAQVAARHGLGVSASALDALNGYCWPGNLRELSMVLERAACLATTDLIRPEDLRLAPTPPVLRAAIGGHASRGAGERIPLEHGRQELLDALHATHGDIAAMTSRLGISRATLYRSLKKHGVTRKPGGG